MTIFFLNQWNSFFLPTHKIWTGLKMVRRRKMWLMSPTHKKVTGSKMRACDRRRESEFRNGISVVGRSAALESYNLALKPKFRARRWRKLRDDYQPWRVDISWLAGRQVKNTCFFTFSFIFFATRFLKFWPSGQKSNALSIWIGADGAKFRGTATWALCILSGILSPPQQHKSSAHSLSNFPFSRADVTSYPTP